MGFFRTFCPAALCPWAHLPEGALGPFNPGDWELGGLKQDKWANFWLGHTCVYSPSDCLAVYKETERIAEKVHNGEPLTPQEREHVAKGIELVRTAREYNPLPDLAKNSFKYLLPAVAAYFIFNKVLK